MESQTKLISWYWKRKPTWRKYLITYNSHPRIMFPEWLSFGERGDFVWNWMSSVKGLEEFRMQLDKGSRGSWKMDNFHGRHMCIISKSQVSVLPYDLFPFLFFLKKNYSSRFFLMLSFFMESPWLFVMTDWSIFLEKKAFPKTFKNFTVKDHGGVPFKYTCRPP